MNRRYVGLIIAEAIIIMFLLVGVAVLFGALNRTTPLSSLPAMPTYELSFPVNTPLSTTLPVSNTITPSFALPAPASPTQTLFPLFILNGTPVYSLSASNPIYSSSIPSSPISVTVWTYTPTPLSAAVWTYTPTPPTSVPPVQTCKNILYPVTIGRQWLYQANALGRTVDMSMKVNSVNNSQGNVLLNNQSTGSTKQVQVQCDGDVIRSFPFMSADVMFGSALYSNMTVSYVSGVLAPNEVAFLRNNWALAWSSQYLVSGTTVLNRNGTQLSVTLNNSPVTLTCQTLASGDAAFETVTVAAGTFRALKVACSEQGQVTATVNGISVTGSAEGRSYQWFAPNVGLVKMQVDYAVVKVLDVSFSLLSNNYLELKSTSSTP